MAGIFIKRRSWPVVLQVEPVVVSALDDVAGGVSVIRWARLDDGGMVQECGFAALAWWPEVGLNQQVIGAATAGGIFNQEAATKEVLNIAQGPIL